MDPGFDLHQKGSVFQILDRIVVRSRDLVEQGDFEIKGILISVVSDRVLIEISGDYMDVEISVYRLQNRLVTLVIVIRHDDFGLGRGCGAS